MRQRLLPIVLALVAVLGFVGYTPPAEATHAGTLVKSNGPHENSPRPPVVQSGGTCVVQGEVHIGDEHGSGGVPVVPQALGKNHNHFRFGSTNIVCNGGPVEGAFDVHAAGGTDGQGECNGLPGKDPKCSTTNHGEDSAAGWSHSDCYVDDCLMMPKMPKDVDDIYDGTNTNGGTDCYNCGEIYVSGAVGRSCQTLSGNSVELNPDDELCANFLKFCRGVYDDTAGGTVISDGVTVPDHTCSNTYHSDGTHASTGGSNVLAWGALVNWSQNKSLVVCFLADVELTPLVLPSGHAPPVGKVDFALINGVAHTWSAANKAQCAGPKNPLS